MDLNIKNKNQILTQLTTLFCETYSLYFKFQVCHWHVTGPHFKELHIQFEDNYTALATIIDDLAERIVTLGGKTPMSLAAIQSSSTITQKEIKTAEKMVKELVKDSLIVIEQARTIANISAKNNDEGTTDIITPIISSLEKATWMLESYLK